MAAAPSSETQLHRAREGELNVQRVLAESALLIERVIAWLRLLGFLVLGAMRGLTNLFTDVGARGHAELDGPRIAVTLLYGVFCLGVLLQLRRETPSPRRSLLAPFFLIPVDFAFFFSMQAMQTISDGHLAMHNTAISSAVLIGWCVGRRSVWHLVLSTVLSLASLYLLVGLEPASRWGQTLFVAASYLSLSVLTWATNRRIGNMFVDLRRRDALTRFLPRQVADRILAAGGVLLPVQREVTVLFSDLRGFTRLSEKLAPAEVLALLDEYFARMTELVKGRDGMVNKFIGDGLLAVWGVPEANSDHATLAARCALDMQKAVEELNVGRVAAGKVPLQVGIGLHTGIVAAGMLGGAVQAEYTVIGDVVNLASRVEGLTKEFSAKVLVTEETRRQLAENFVAAHPPEPLGEVTVKGRDEPVTVWQLA